MAQAAGRDRRSGALDLPQLVDLPVHAGALLDAPAADALIERVDHADPPVERHGDETAPPGQ